MNYISLLSGLSCGMSFRYLVTSDICPRINSKKTLCILLFDHDILNSEDDYIDTPTLIKKVKY